MKEIEFIEIDKSGSGFLKPEPASRYIPKWFKGIPVIRKISPLLGSPNSGKDFTIKKCSPVLDAFSSGYVLVTTRDMIWSIDKKGNHNCSFSDISIDQKYKPITMHPYEQIKDINLEGIYNEYAYKFSNPYLIKTPPGYSCLMTHPFNQINPFYTMTGVVDTDSHPLSVQFPFLMIKNYEGIIKAGTPIVQILPFYREEWRMSEGLPDNLDRQNHSKASEDFEKSRYSENGTPIGGEYKNNHRARKRYR